MDHDSRFTDKRADAEVEPTNATSAEPQTPAAISQVSVNVDHVFARSSNLRFLTFVYNALATSIVPAGPSTQPGAANVGANGANAAAIDLAVQVQIFRDDEPVITNPLHKIQTEGLPDIGRVPYAAEVRLEDLQPGAYMLQVTVIDRLSKSSTSQRVSFQVQ